MDYDFSQLPAEHSRRDLLVLAGGIAGFVGYAFAMVSGVRQLLTVFEYLLVLDAISVAGYFWISAYSDKKAFEKFTTKYAVSEMTGDAMAASIPPCFGGLKDRPDIIDVGIRDGYVFALPDDRNCGVFIFYYTTKDNGPAKTQTYTVARLQQQRQFPHLFLEGKQVGALYSYDKSQRLGLEGDFDSYFNLYVPDGEQVDALTILSPDVMQALIDGGRPYDIELDGYAITLISSGSVYIQPKLSLLFGFLTSITDKLNSGSGEFDKIDLTAAANDQLIGVKGSPMFLACGFVAVALLMLIASIYLKD
jgi:hypothetical protein